MLDWVSMHYDLWVGSWAFRSSVLRRDYLIKFLPYVTDSNHDNHSGTRDFHVLFYSLLQYSEVSVMTFIL